VCLLTNETVIVIIIGGGSEAAAADGARPRDGVANTQPKQTAFVSIS